MAEGLLFPRAMRLLNEPVFVRKEDIDNDHPPVFRHHRFGDAMSPLNADLHDSAAMLLTAIRMVDQLGITILSVDADQQRNKRIHVAYSRECDALEGVEVRRCAEWSVWCANRYGTEIRWCIPMEAA